MNFIKRIIDRNKGCGNKRGDFNPELAKRLIMEEVRETRIAIDAKDKIEITDGAIDTCIVMIGELHKLGLTQKQIEQAFTEILNSNDTKLVDGKAIKNEQGKIMKPKSYKKPDLSFLK